MSEEAQRTEAFTVNVGTFHGTTIDITFEIEATVWSGTHGVGGVVSARPTEIHLADREGSREVPLGPPDA